MNTRAQYTLIAACAFATLGNVLYFWNFHQALSCLRVAYYNLHFVCSGRMALGQLFPDSLSDIKRHLIESLFQKAWKKNSFLPE